MGRTSSDGVPTGAPLSARYRDEVGYVVNVSRGMESYRFKEAAAACAWQLGDPDQVWELGHKTLTRALRTSARSGLTGVLAVERADPGLAARYRELLVRHRVFPPDATEG